MEEPELPLPALCADDAAAAAAAMWGDLAVGEPSSQKATDGHRPLPAPYHEGPDADGIKRYVTFRYSPEGTLQRVTRMVRVVTRQITITKRMAERRAGWKKFGAALTDTANVTYVSNEEVFLEPPPNRAGVDGAYGVAAAAAARRAAEAAAAASGATMSCRLCGGAHWSMACPRRKELGEEGTAAALAAAAAAKGGSVPPAPAAPAAAVTAAAYVPPTRSATGAAAPGGDKAAALALRRELRVNNLAEDVDEDTVRALFAPFGRIDRVTVPRDRDTGRGRCFAFVSFESPSEAARAKEAVHGMPLDYLIVAVDWAPERVDRPGEGPGARGPRIPSRLMSYTEKLGGRKTE